MATKHLVIAGGAGALGRAVARYFANQGYSVSILTRTARLNIPFRQLVWDGKNVDEAWGKELAGSVLLNLAGELVDRVPTNKNIDLLESSRVEPTEALVRASKEFGAPKLWLQMSTLAIYGDAGEVELNEESEPAAGPRQMAGVANAWEFAARAAKTERLVILRTAVVLQKNTPALGRLVTMTKLFLGGQVGSGRQWFSWIHFNDFVRALEFVISTPKIDGVVHLTSPLPVNNAKLMQTLRRLLHRPWTPATPAWAIRLGAWLLFRTDPMLALTGRRAIPKKLVESGFRFEHPELEEALVDLLSAEASS